MSRLFGTDGVRGVANDELTPLLAMQLGQAGAYVLTKENEHKPTIMVGCDTRISGDMLANALMAGICSVGANAVYVGVIPTPAVAYLTENTRWMQVLLFPHPTIRESLTELNFSMETDISFRTPWRMRLKPLSVTI